MKIFFVKFVLALNEITNVLDVTSVIAVLVVTRLMYVNKAPH
jgi:hypothetical protein